MFDLKKSLGDWTPQKGQKTATDNIKQALQALTDTTYRGGVAGIAGAPMDMTNMLANALRTGSNAALGTDYKQVENPIGGSEWIGKQLQNAGVISPTRRPMGELLAGIASPDPMDLMRLAPLGAAVLAGGKAMPEMDLVDIAKKSYGLTRNPLESGYILPTGEMLDMTGRHQAGG